MRFSVSLLGAIGVALTVASISMLWLVVEHVEQNGSPSEYLLTDFDNSLGADISDTNHFAYSTALYLIVIGMVVSVSSLLGGFITLAGVSTFAIGGLVGDNPILSFGSSEAYEVNTYPGIGFYLAIIATVIMIISMRYPLEVGFGTGDKRSRFRTWHLSRGSKATVSEQEDPAQDKAQ